MTETLARIFIPICKIDEEKRLVYGKMTFEAEDSSGEIWDYEGSKPYFEAWSANAEKTSGGKSLGNLRSMHQPIAAGKLTQFLLNDEDKSVEIAAKVVDDAEWGKVLEGVYTGFSQGGRYVKRWKDPDDATKTRFISDPVECSIVDLPCLPGATLEYIKADGSVEVRKLSKEITMDPTNEQIEARAKELAKDAGDEGAWADHIGAARDDLVAKAVGNSGEPAAPAQSASEDGASIETPAPETEKAAGGEGEAAGEDESVPLEDSATKTISDEERRAAREALSQVWKTTDGQTFAKCDDAVAHQATVKTEATPPLSPVEAALKTAKGEEEAGKETSAEKFVPTEDLDIAKATIETCIAKGLYSASRALCVLDSVISLQNSSAWEEEYEGDGSGVPAQLAEAARSLGTATLAMCQEEIAEALSDLGGEGVEIDVYLSENAIFVEDAAQAEFVKTILADEELVAKVGARNSKKDAASVQKIHDETVELGAECAMDDETDKALEPDELAKRAERDPVVRHLLDRNVELSGEVEKALTGIADLGKTIEDLRRTPAPMAPRSHVIGKTETGDEVDVTKAEALVAELSKTQAGQRVLAEAAIRGSQAAGGHRA